MKNETIILYVIGGIAVYLFLKNRNIGNPLDNALNPPDSFSHDSSPSSRYGGSDLTNGWGYTQEDNPAPPGGAVDETTGHIVNAHSNLHPVPKQPFTKPGNFQNSTTAYSPKFGKPTNNIRLLPGKVNAQNKTGLGIGRPA